MASLSHDKQLWKYACELARSGEYANVIIIERELRRRGVLAREHITTNVMRRELLTRVCHAARNGGADEDLSDEKLFGPGGGYWPGYA